MSLNYPGIGFKYILKRNIFELRLQKISDYKYETTLLGFRYYRIFGGRGTIFYIGAEGASFNTKGPYPDESSGQIFGGFAGIERFILKQVSLNIDIGPYVAVASKPGGISVSVTANDFVMNASINFYIFRR
ncbi:MAG: hypothetical protein NZ870_00820 [bacterium]|nr:hypothetical protein [bacterium]